MYEDTKEVSKSRTFEDTQTTQWSKEINEKTNSYL